MVRHMIGAVLALLPLMPIAAAPRMIPLRAFERAMTTQADSHAALTAWCAAQRVGEPATFAAERFADPYPGKTSPIYKLLQLGPDDALVARNLILKCGSTDMAVVYTWYAPTRLTAEVDSALADSDAPFEPLAAPMRVTRQPLTRTRGGMMGCPTDTVLSYLALFKTPAGESVGVVIECYAAANLRGG